MESIETDTRPTRDQVFKYQRKIKLKKMTSIVFKFRFVSKSSLWVSQTDAQREDQGHLWSTVLVVTEPTRVDFHLQFHPLDYKDFLLSHAFFFFLRASPPSPSHRSKMSSRWNGRKQTAWRTLIGYSQRTKSFRWKVPCGKFSNFRHNAASSSVITSYPCLLRRGSVLTTQETRIENAS